MSLFLTKKSITKIKILVQGYAREKGGIEYASSTATLIQDNNLNIIVDPGIDKPKLLRALKKGKLSPRDIDFVVLTHCHPDHSLLAGIFEKAKILDSEFIYQLNGKITEHQFKIPRTNIKIIKTPGHSLTHCSLFLKTEEYGRLTIAGDLFWWFDGAPQKNKRKNLMALRDPFAEDKKALRASRKKILKISDYIIPGHGKIFEISN